jgi:hypothetical protein
MEGRPINGTFLLDRSKGLEWSIKLHSNTEMETHYSKKGKNMPYSFLLDGANWPVDK